MRKNGFTLIEMSVVVAIIGVLYSTVVPMYGATVRKAKETALKEDLQVIRKTLDVYFKDHQVWPRDLSTLVSEGYLRAIPVDPITDKTDSWILVPSAEGMADVFDVKSGAQGASEDGTLFSSW